ncbi:MAG: ATP-dependent helicase [Erysipelotrichales bacterium]|nr:ATP-dependent helicase [Erysipelotrichales bacterium]
MSDYLDRLNAAQKEAVETTEGPVIVIAGAGSGKTRVLTSRMVHLINNHGIVSDTILAVTFTNKATREMRDRVNNLINRNDEFEAQKKLHIYTFHALGKWILHQYITLLGYKKNFEIINDDDSLKIVKGFYDIFEINTKSFPPEKILDYISREKNLEEIFLQNELADIYEKLSKAYKDYTRKNNLVDFDDLLYLTLQLLENFPEVRKNFQENFSYILVDEFQDTNMIQFKILIHLAEIHQNIFIVGDQDQSIYAFRGANYKNLNYFMDYFPNYKLIKLEENYRSSQNILDVANNLIKHNSDRVPKNLYSKRLEAPKVFYKRFMNYREEVHYIAAEILKKEKQGIPFSEMAVIYRNNALSRNFEEIFIQYKIPYVIYGGLSFYARMEVKDLIAYLRVILKSESDFFLKRIFNIPKHITGIGGKTFRKMEEFAESKQKSIFDILLEFPFTEKQKAIIEPFYQTIIELRTKIEELSMPDFIDLVLDKTGYLQHLKDIEKDNTDRVDNVNEFKSIFFEVSELHLGHNNHETFQLLLNDLVLKTDADFSTDETPRVRLSNYHQVKGLEFEVVFLPCLEQGIFPSLKSLMSTFDTEEERRVCYVGLTRSKEYLYLTNSQERLLYGNYNRFSPSQFVQELDISLLENLNANKSLVQKRPTPVRPQKLSSGTEYRPGDLVVHQIFETGIVIRIEGDVLEVAFKAPFGMKKVMKDHPSICKQAEEKDECVTKKN